MSLKRDMADLVAAVVAQGWAAEPRRGGGHWRLRAPDGRLVFAALTPSDPRAVKNARAVLRRHGARL